jgi:hypothetical protein
MQLPENAARRALGALALAVTVPATAAETPLHEQVLDYLRGHRGAVAAPLPDLHPRHTAFNAEAPIPPQCYTKHDGRHNPCYVCHQNQVPGRENAMNDGELQVEYAFSDVGMTNHWENLFEDRTAAIAAISDEEILDWIDDDNYSALAPALQKAGFEGWIPDLAKLELGAAAFDQHGFAKDGSHWVAFNYKPFPSTFWPTNGSTDDVMIRLPAAFRSDADGNHSADVYRANLAIVEATVKGLPEISALPFDEARVGKDLDGDGRLGRATRVTKLDAYVGAAAKEYLDTYLYPKGTEFLHTVRYVGLGADGSIVPSKRMKEVRYMRKWTAFSKRTYARHYELGGFEKEAGALPRPTLLGDAGLDNGYGWSVQGFIEGVDGRLRTATYEENLFCMGCHSSVGATIDKTFAFPRKLDGAAGWGYIDLRGMPDAPNVGETVGEIATYLARVGGGSEFRNNEEMAARWFRADGTPDSEAIARAKDVYELITPSRERALALNKAYRTIVAAQDYLYGRDATVTPPENVHRHIDNDSAQTLPLEYFRNWDIRLAWPGAAK